MHRFPRDNSSTSVQTAGYQATTLMPVHTTVGRNQAVAEPLPSIALDELTHF